uniref:Uncharacterized protein n=2 Tax=Chaetoceros debilis TaxID=122233 RepID=A0A7S3Q289_9STRA|mmetsp:Transcript_27250/g.41757  ORF Transcript_27250/g.41757 Transcript_27250/m.41757 type:complete len:626 (+) Transcript_27250:108-1985(+)
MSKEPKSDSQKKLPAHVQRRNRSIAEREAARLARPDRPSVQSLAHANRAKSAVSSTPFGIGNFKGTNASSISSSALENESSAASSDWCGPFSVARQMIAAREEARALRENEKEEKEQKSSESHPLDAVLQAAILQNKIKANPSMTWRGKLVEIKDSSGKAENLYQKRSRRYKRQKLTAEKDHSSQISKRIPSLYDLCVKFIVNNFESVEALGLMIDSTIRRSICEALVSTGRMNGAAFDTLAEEGIETLEITDCVSVTQEAMVEALEKLVPAGLRALILNHAGRAFGTNAVDAILRSTSSELFALSISGAYLLKDLDASRLVAKFSRTLSSIEFNACPSIGSDFCNSLSTHFSSSADSSLLLELSLREISLTRDQLISLGTSSDALRNLRSISLRQMDAMDDETLSKILESTQGNLKFIDLSNDVNLTDESLLSIRRYNSKGNLSVLNLCGLKNLTAVGLEAFFTFGIDGLPNPPNLRTLDLSSCDFNAVNENVVNLAISSSALKRSQDDESRLLKVDTLKRDLSALGGLVSLDVSNSSVTDKVMENLASTCSSSLKLLKVNFCPNISDNGLGYLVSKCGTQFSSVEIWGCAQISDIFLDGNHGAGRRFEIEGAWMKSRRDTASK